MDNSIAAGMKAEGGTLAMTQQQIRLLFVSGQLTPAVLATYHYAGRIAALELLATPSMKGRASELRKEVERIATQEHVAIAVNVRKLRQDGDADPPAHHDDVLQHARRAAQAHPDALLVFDITGGTKLMALAMFRVAEQLRGEGLPVAVSYTNTDANAFQWILPEPATEPMAVELTVEELLHANGYQVQAIRSNDGKAFEAMRARRELTEQVMGRLSGSEVGLLNAWAHRAREAFERHGAKAPHRVARQDLQVRNTPPTGLLQQLKLAGALDYELDSNHQVSALLFNTADWAAYLSGDWLEEWAWWQLEGIAGLRSWELGVQVRRRDVPNELDLVLSCRNRLLVVEIKTAALMAGRGRDSKEADVLYKIDALLHKLAPVYGTAMLLSWQPFSETALKRARDGRLYVLANQEGDGARLPSPHQLRQVVMEWMDKGKLPRQD